MHATRRTLILCGAREQPAALIEDSALEEMIGRENVCENVQHALARAEDAFEGMEAKAAWSGA